MRSAAGLGLRSRKPFHELNYFHSSQEVIPSRDTIVLNLKIVNEFVPITRIFPDAFRSTARVN
jgi:hypothetical protein